MVMIQPLLILFQCIVSDSITSDSISWQIVSDYVLSEEDILINSTQLYSNIPNPFNPLTTISYQVSEPCIVVLEIYNIKGQKIKTLLNEIKEIGFYDVEWNGKDDNNQSVSSGLYLYRMKTKNYSEMKKMLMLK